MINRTIEQKAAINAVGEGKDIRLNAVAGSGKTTTLHEIVKEFPQKRFLYVCFNRSVREEAIRKFSQCSNVVVETAHSLAYRMTGVKTRWEVDAGDFRPHNIARWCQFGYGQKQDIILARHVQNFLTRYFNSRVRDICQFDYVATLRDTQAQQVAMVYRDDIIQKAANIALWMQEGDIKMTHDCYLKMFQLQNYRLDFDYILFDEGQDASPVMLDSIMSQDCGKVIVGDKHQAIYSFRSAINAMEQVDFEKYSLTESFRFGQPIADTAMNILRLKAIIADDYEPVRIIGSGNPEPTQREVRAIIARSNLGLLDAAIEECFRRPNPPGQVAFEGDITSYLYLEEGGNLFDLLSLQQNQPHKVKDELLAHLGSMDAVKEYVAETGDRDIEIAINVVEKYGGSLHHYIKGLRSIAVPRDNARTIFSTVHKAKGMEYDQVTLVNDYTTESSIRQKYKAYRQQLVLDANTPPLNYDDMLESINILYVGATRSKRVLDIPFAFDETIGSVCIGRDSLQASPVVTINMRRRNRRIAD